MSLANVILWRHGQTDYNAAGKLQGQVDIPLNATGISQATQAAAVLSGVRPSVVITSDLSRAADTAKYLAEQTGVETIVDTRLRERSFGDWEGLTRQEIHQRWPDEYEVWRRGGHPQGINAESRGDLGARIAEAVDEWAREFEISDTVVFVGHGAAISSGITTLLGQDPESWRGISGLSNCHWSVLEPGAGQPKWRLTGHNVGP
ncbi:MAG TPA: histidine phosphatase family protein [Beutenbergiaceae bacterium]|nr:histidine phosphatase family protein [Beutenbergiaceae bacterium]